jgi:hypothetical protein
VFFSHKNLLCFYWYRWKANPSKFNKQSSVKLKNGADFLNGVQVAVEILTLKIRMENGD